MVKVLNFLFALLAIYKREFWFVSENMCSISLQHVNCMSYANREKPLIFHDKNDIIELLGRKITKMHHYFDEKSINVALSLGVYAAVIVKGWQVLRYHNNISGGVSPNHYFDNGEKSKEDLVKLLKIYGGGKKGVVAAEAKVYILLFHQTPPGMCPYFVSDIS